jgi:hypothetical protein
MMMDASDGSGEADLGASPKPNARPLGEVGELQLGLAGTEDKLKNRRTLQHNNAPSVSQSPARLTHD